MANFTTNEILEGESGHKHEWEFYDNYSENFDQLTNRNKGRQEDPKECLPIGTVYECYCGAREIRFIVFTGQFDPRKRNA